MTDLACLRSYLGRPSVLW